MRKSDFHPPQNVDSKQQGLRLFYLLNRFGGLENLQRGFESLPLRQSFIFSGLDSFLKRCCILSGNQRFDPHSQRCRQEQSACLQVRSHHADSSRSRGGSALSEGRSYSQPRSRCAACSLTCMSHGSRAVRRPGTLVQANVVAKVYSVTDTPIALS